MTEELLNRTELQFSGASDKGRIRKKNEDNFAVLAQQQLFFVADGVGGMPAGDIASMLVVEVLPPLIEQRMPHPENSSTDEIIETLKQAIIDLSNRILSQSRNRPEYKGMGSTLALVWLVNETVYIANLGDSRVYLMRKNQLQQITDDHTLVHHLLKNQAITAEEAINHPGKSQLVQYVGMQRTPEPDVFCIPRVLGEQLLICSDGLTDMLSDNDIEQFLSQQFSPKKACATLVDAANRAGGRDNITVIVIA